MNHDPVLITIKCSICFCLIQLIALGFLLNNNYISIKKRILLAITVTVNRNFEYKLTNPF